jgi:tetratricopeptide (TPR) repeat protein
MKILKDTKYSYLTELAKKNNEKATKILIAGLILLFLGFVFVLFFLIGFAVIGVAIAFYKQASFANAGKRGEIMVTNTLKELDDSHYLINDIKLHSKAGNIDHVLFSPKGIFAIETKNWTGTIRCKGDDWGRKIGNRYEEEKSVSNQARKNAKDLYTYIYNRTQKKVFVSPICVFANPSVKLRIYKPTLPVLRIDELTRYITNVKSTIFLTEYEIMQIANTILPEVQKIQLIEWKNMGDDLIKKGDYNSAIERFKNVLEVDPENKDVWNNLGVAYIKTGNIDEAKKCHEKIDLLKKGI